MLEGIVYHTLKGVPGLSSLSLNVIDVAKVLEMSWHKRAFCIQQREFPFTLHMTYKHGKTYLTPAPVFTANGFGTALQTAYSPTQPLTRRYATEEDIKQEIEMIEKKQKLLRQYNYKIQEQLESAIKNIEKSYDLKLK